MNNDKLESVLVLIFFGLVLFTSLMFVSVKFFPDNGPLFTTIAGLVGGFSGSFFTRIKSKTDGPSIPDGGSGTQTTIVKVPGEEIKK